MEQAEARPADESAQKVHGVGGLDLGPELGGEVGIVLAVGEQGGVAQLRGGTAQVAPLERVRTVQRLELRGAIGDAIRVVKLFEELVCEGHAFSGFGCFQGLADCIGDVAGKDVWAIVVLDVREDRLKRSRSVEQNSKTVRFKPFIQTFIQLIGCLSPTENQQPSDHVAVIQELTRSEGVPRSSAHVDPANVGSLKSRVSMLQQPQSLESDDRSRPNFT
ncbi:hypothetical protein SRABI128_05932 [Microbacterium sp. Bi128]|nr:hypothetical protein SRABI128_05932 [Microbacterium sp. Bi128]